MARRVPLEDATGAVEACAEVGATSSVAGATRKRRRDTPPSPRRRVSGARARPGSGDVKVPFLGQAAVHAGGPCARPTRVHHCRAEATRRELERRVPAARHQVPSLGAPRRGELRESGVGAQSTSESIPLDSGCDAPGTDTKTFANRMQMEGPFAAAIGPGRRRARSAFGTEAQHRTRGANGVPWGRDCRQRGRVVDDLVRSPNLRTHLPCDGRVALGAEKSLDVTDRRLMP